FYAEGKRCRMQSAVCLCECGNYCIRTANELKYSIKSCGCLQIQSSSKASYRHGDTNKKSPHSRLNSIHRGIKQRCLNPKSKGYHRYGGRGIKICDRWMDYQNFKQDALKMGYADN